MAAPYELLVDFAEDVTKDDDFAVLYFGNDHVAVQDLRRNEDFPGLIYCRTANGEQFTFVASSLIAVKAVAKPAGEETDR